MKRSPMQRRQRMAVAGIILVTKGVIAMLYWALVFLVVAIVAAVFGFGGIATAAAGLAQILFFIFLVVFIVSLVFGLLRRGY